jgi:hypothetical protein
MEPLDYIPLLIVLVLAPMAALGRWLMLNSEMRNAKRTRATRELQARFDKERFDRELSDEAMRAGAR